MRINQRGNVGIGTTNPQSKLDVRGTGYIEGNLTIRNNADNWQTFVNLTNDVGTVAGISLGNSGNTVVGAGNLGFYYINALNNYAMRLLSNGNTTFGANMTVSGTTTSTQFVLPTNTDTSLYWNGTVSSLGRANGAGNYSTSAAVGDIVLRSANKVILQSGSGASGLMIDTNNNVGIGISPAARLHVGSGSYNGGTVTYGYLNQSGAAGNISSVISAICAVFDSAVWCKGTYVASSDTRIKKDIEDINDDSALQKILTIQPKTYKYIDHISKGDKTVYGFIAQQIKEVIPEAVIIQKETIPNIYDKCEYSSNVISFESDLSLNDIQLSSNIKLYNCDNKETICQITGYTSNSISIDKHLEHSCNVFFAYGTQVDDFHALDKNYIYTLNVCATQELHKMIQKQNDIIASLLNRIEILENKQ
jgi:hypothetical protein